MKTLFCPDCRRQPVLSLSKESPPTRINQVLNNLISNAKFTDEGAVTLRAFCEGDSHRDIP